MRRGQWTFSLLLLVIGGCAAVPRDAGLGEVRSRVAERTGSAIDAHPIDPAADEARVRAMLDRAIDADHAVAIALVNSPRVHLALAGLGIARADLIAASTVANPILGAEVRFPNEPRRPFEWTLSQSLLDLVTLPRRRAMGRAAFEAAKLRTTREILSVAAGARSAWIEAVAAARMREAAMRLAESARTAAELAQRQHAAGNISDLELEMRQVDYEEAKLELAAIDAALGERREALGRAMGLRGDEAEWQTVTALDPLPPGEIPDDEIEAMAASRRLDLQAARWDAERARLALPVAVADAIGEIEVDVHLEREPEGARTRGPGIDVPIPIFGRGRAARERGLAELDQAMSRIADIAVVAGSELRIARDRIRIARARVEYLRDVVVPRRERILRLTQLEYNGMVAGIYQLLRARDQYVVVERDSLDAHRAYWQARNDLERAIDGLEAASGTDPAKFSTAGVAASRAEGH